MKAVTKFIRLDKVLVDRGLVATMPRAKELIQNGAVRVNGAIITSAHCPIDDGHNIEISGVDSPWVSPDAIRLFDALEALKFDVKGRVAVDIGAGVGGFTEALLQKGIKKVYAVDTEANLLHSSLTLNPRIKNLHRINAKDLQKTHIEDVFDLVVTDIGTENYIETVSPVLNMIEGGFDLLIFVDDKKTAKDIERQLRMDYGMLAKKVPDAHQVIWLQKKA